MKIRITIATLLCSSLLTACSDFGRASRINPAVIATQNKAGTKICPLIAGLKGDAELAIDLSCYRFADGLNPGNSSMGEANKAAKNTNALAIQSNDATEDQIGVTVDTLARAKAQAERAAVQAERDAIVADRAVADTAYQLALTNKIYRNRLESDLLTHADQICVNEKGGIFGAQTATNLALDLLSLTTSTASTIVGGDQAKSILGGVSAVATGGRASVNENVYRGQIVSAITKVMDGQRQKVLDILVSQRSTEIDSYPVEEMIRLVNRYHQSCSFENGLQLLLDAAVNKAGYENIIADLNAKSRASYINGQLTLAKNLGLTFSKEQDDAIKKELFELITKKIGSEESVDTSSQLLPK